MNEKQDWFSHKRCSVCGKLFMKVANKEIHEQYVHGIDHGRARNGRRLIKQELQDTAVGTKGEENPVPVIDRDFSETTQIVDPLVGRLYTKEGWEEKRERVLRTKLP